MFEFWYYSALVYQCFGHHLYLSGKIYSFINICLIIIAAVSSFLQFLFPSLRLNIPSLQALLSLNGSPPSYTLYLLYKQYYCSSIHLVGRILLIFVVLTTQFDWLVAQLVFACFGFSCLGQFQVLQLIFIVMSLFLISLAVV